MSSRDARKYLVDYVEREVYKQQKQHPAHGSPLIFGDPEAPGEFYVTNRAGIRSSIKRALMRGLSTKEIIRHSVYYQPKSIHIGGEYKFIARIMKEPGFGGALLEVKTGTGRVIQVPVVAETLQKTYHPSHIQNQLSHETLHHVLEKTSGERASRAIDQYDVFGSGADISPTGMVDFEIMQRRMADEIARHERERQIRRFSR